MHSNLEKTRIRRLRFRGFTLLEVVLAIGLAGTVVALLATAIDLYLMRVDANRSRVESAQLARALLTQIADDIRAARYWLPTSGQGGRGGSGGGGSGFGGSGGGSGGTGSDSSSSSSGGSDSSSSTGMAATDTETAGKVVGIFGTATELRIDRATRWQWERTTREIDPADPASQDELPQTVLYFFNDGDTLLADQLAALGVLAEPALPGYAGLYRQQSGTAARKYQSSATGVSLSAIAQEAAELLAPEVLDLEFAYFDGTQMLQEWDSAQQGRLPRGVEIRLTLLEEPFELALAETPQDREAQLHTAENMVEYRLYVRLPNLRPRQIEAPRRGSREGSGRQDAGQGGSGGSSSGN
jgi:type II secretory pathway pseudopilin PulG